MLIGTGAGGPDRVPRPQNVRDAYAAAIGLPFEEFGRRTMPMTFSPGWTERNPQRFEEILAARGEHPTPEVTLDAHLQACYGFYARRCEVERIDAPALVLHGEADVIVPVENGRMLASRLPNARFVELPGRGHNLPLEDPATVNRLTLRFLAKAPLSRRDWVRRFARTCAGEARALQFGSGGRLTSTAGTAAPEASPSP